MSILDLFRKKRKLSAQEKSEMQIMMKQISECKNIIFSTTDPNTFFSRLNLALENLLYLKKFEAYDNVFSDMTPTKCYESIMLELKPIVNNFILRATIKKLGEIEKLQTEKAKRSNLEKFFDDMLAAINNSDKFYNCGSRPKLYLGNLYTQDNLQYFYMLRQKYCVNETSNHTQHPHLNTNSPSQGEKAVTSNKNHNFPNSIAELNKGELILLKYFNYTEINRKGEIELPNYFLTQYELSQNSAQEIAIKYLNLFLDFNLLEEMSIDTTIKKHTIPQIKEVLKTKSITVKGKKADQIQALYDNFTIDELTAAFPPKYYVLSESGKRLLDERLDTDDWENRYNNVDFDEAKNEIDLLIASEAYKKTILYTNNPYHNVPDYVLKNHEVFICTVIYSSGCKTAKRILHRLFGIEDTQFFAEKYDAVLRSEKELLESKESDKLLKNGYKEFYQVCSMEDECVCNCCAEFNNKWLPVSKAVIGVNYPPFANCTSKHCRCFANFEFKQVK